MAGACNDYWLLFSFIHVELSYEFGWFEAIEHGHLNVRDYEVVALAKVVEEVLDFFESLLAVWG